jgi:hypothetical protein
MNNDIREIVSNLGSSDHFMKGHNNQAEDDISAKLDELIALLKK